MTRDEEIVLFHYQLGVAITEWANVENLLRRLIVTGFKNIDLNWEALSVGFFSLEGFRAKLDFADGVVSRKIAATPHISDWLDLVDRAKRLSFKRNKLAHWALMKYWECEPGQRLALTPWKFPKSRKKTKVPQPPPGSLRIRDVMKIHLEFKALAVSLENFCARLCKQTEPHPKADEQAGSPPTIQKLKLQIRAILSPPHAPSAEKS